MRSLVTVVVILNALGPCVSTSSGIPHHHHHSMPTAEAPIQTTNASETKEQMAMNHHGGVQAVHGMPMYFNAELGFNVLFKSWSLDTAGDVVGASFGFFFVAVFYEALKWFRDRLMRQAIARSVERNRQKQGKSLRCSATEETTITLLVLDHILQIVLHMIQIFVSYLLMLVFMTYNVWLAVSIVFGSGVGYGLFNVRIRVRGCEQVAPSKKNEHCQH